VDIIGCPRIEDDGTKENAGGQHRADFKADRRGHSAKGVQSWTFPRHASLKSASQIHARSIQAPPLCGAFIVGRMERSELVEPRHHVRRGVKSASEDALRKCESIYSPGGYSRTTILAPIVDAARGATDDSEEAGRKSSGKPSPWRRANARRAVAPFPRPATPRVGLRSRNFAAPFHRKISFAIGRILRTPGRTRRSVRDSNSADGDARSG
jgi:hypothetical protein